MTDFQISTLFQDNYSQEQFIEKFEYLTNKSRGKQNFVTLRTLAKKYQYGGIAALLKRYDPTAYYQMKNEK